MKNHFIIILFVVSCLFLSQLHAQKRNKQQQEPPVDTVLEAHYLTAMKWRNIGPFRGGRSTTVCGVPSQPHVFYMGTTGGGVWKTTDGGGVWRNVSDGFFQTGSVGAIAVAESDPNVIYVGMGEAPIRGVMTSHGDGVYKSTDGGKSWRHVGLKQVRQISRVRVHPANSDIVYVAAQGSPYTPTEDRGVYRSMDGGESWEKVLFVNEKSGVSDMSMDMTNPRILYAAFWEHQRLPWKMVSGGTGSSIWKSKDGGDNWEHLEEGLPDSVMGKIGVVVSPANPQRVWAIIESEQGGLYRSDDGGEKWQLINDKRVLRARSWYYMHIFADPHNPDKVVVLNAPFMQSIDGGKSFTQIPTPHGDNHDLWIHPEQPDIMINANDGGANISYNGGKTWSTQGNQPTAQFYRVNADHRFPYYVYGGQQDNSTVAIPNNTFNGGIQNADFYSVGGCESAFTAFYPDDPRFVYAGCYQGIITRYDQELKQAEDVMAYPFLGLGENAGDLPYRFNWNAPIVMSQHDPSVIYHTAQNVLMSNDRGQSWAEISPDLTRKDSSKIDWGGGPITNEAAGGENYHTLMYLAESPHDAATLWVGADDGLVHITRNGGKNWMNITPPNVEEGMANCIEVSPHTPGKAYLAYNRYKFNDFTPHIFITNDYGETWQRKVQGIPEDTHVRVVREDPDREGLLYAGTETGLYVSFDGGERWQSFQNNLPVVPVTDLKVHQQDLIAATQGRAFWILDDLTPLHQLTETVMNTNTYLFQPRDPYLLDGTRVDSLPDRGTNPDNGLVSYFYIKEKDDSIAVALEIKDESGSSIRSFSPKAKEKSNQMPYNKGQNKFVWDLRLADYELPKELTTYGGKSSYKVGPGKYEIILIIGKDTMSRAFYVKPDSRVDISLAAFEEQQVLLKQVEQALKDMYKEIDNMRHVKSQVEGFIQRTDIDEEVKDQGKKIVAHIDSLENRMVQKKQKTFQDVINFPNQLNAKLMHIQQTIDGGMPPVTQGQMKRVADLMTEWELIEGEILDLMQVDVRTFNMKIKEMDIPFIATETPEEKTN